MEEDNNLPELKKRQSSNQMKLSKKQSAFSNQSQGDYNDYEDDYGYDDSNGYYDDDDDYDENDFDQEYETTNTNQARYQIIYDKEIFTKLQNKISDDIQPLTNLDFDKSLLIFQHYKFSNDKFNDFFSNADQLIKKYGLDMGDWLKIESNLECLICFEDEKGGIQLPCGNAYCYDCIASHIQSKIQQKQVFFGCLEEDCNYHFQNNLIIEILTHMQLEKDLKLYKTNLSRVYAEQCAGIKWCPGLDCNQCIQDESLSVFNVKCDNGHQFCFKCMLQIWHSPCPCSLVSDWNKKNGSSTLDEKWLLANARKCPHCGKFTQRSLGCDFMRCAPPGGCGKAFCYQCLKPITEKDHMAHASCKEKTKQAGQEEAKDYLNKVSKSQEKVKVCEAVLIKAEQIMKEELKEKKEILYDKLGISFQETQFLDKSFQILIDARHALKYSYIFSFQVFILPDKMAQSHSLFEQFQLTFEEHCEKLAKDLDIELNNFLESIKDFPNFYENGPTDANKPKEFFQLKDKINTSSAAIDKSKELMIDAVETGQIYIENE